MISRRNVLSTTLAALSVSAAAGCTTTRQTAYAPQMPGNYPVAPPPPDRASLGLDAVIDISRGVTVTDFRRVRQSNILGVIHKASEGGDYADTAYAARRPQAEAAGLLWGAYHYGTGQRSGEEQAAFFLQCARPGPRTLLALDLEANDNNPSNSMTIDQGEAFVQTVARATRRLPIVYVHPTWANGEPLPNSALRPVGRRLPRFARGAVGLGVERLAPLAVCRRRERGPSGLRPEQHRAGRQPLRSQPVQRRRRRALSVLEYRCLRGLQVSPERPPD
jgi:lysozyme